MTSFADLFAMSLVIVILAILLDLASKRADTLEGIAGGASSIIRRLVDPGIPLVPWPPDDDRRR